VKLERHLEAAMKRAALPGWPRLMNVEMAADYLGVGRTMLEEHGPRPKRWRGRVLYDRQALDLFADALDGQPLDPREVREHSRTVEGDFFAHRSKRGK
jgi:hypothetical protein